MYNPDGLTEIAVESVNDDTVKIVFKPILETLYYCAGLKVSEKYNTIYVSFVRCAIKEKCSVTHEAQQGDNGTYFVLLRNDGKIVSIVFDNGEKKIYPQ